MKISVFSSVFKEIRQSLGRFISILAIVAIGVGFFAGVKASQPDMKESSDMFYRENNLFDLRIVSTLGFNENDIAAIKSAGNAEVFPGYYADYEASTGGKDVVARIYSFDDNNGINQVMMTDGRLPESENECIVEGSGFKSNLSLGDKITLDGDTSDLQNSEYTVVGMYLSPIYISASEFGSTTVGDGSIDTAIYIPAANFNSEYYTQVYLSVDSAANYAAYSDNYTDAVEKYSDIIDEIAARRSDERLAEINTEAAEKIADGETQIADGEKQLSDAKTELDSAAAELRSAKKELNSAASQIADGEKQLESARNTLNSSISSAAAELDEKSAELANGRKQYEAGIDEYNNGLTKYYENAAALEAAAAQLDQLKLMLGADSQQYISAKAQYDESAAALAAAKATLDESFVTLENTKQQLDSGDAAIADGKSQLEAERISGENQINENAAALESAKAEYNSGLIKYNDGKTKYESGLAEYNANEPSALESINNAKQKIADARADIAKINAPEWYIFTRDDNPGYSEYGENAQRIGNIAKIFPVFFLLVAALVCLTTMTRMIDEQRSQIGTLKALGYTGGYIMAKYMIYALLATVVGSALGLIAGFQLFPGVIVNAYTILYNTPYILTPFRWDTAIISTVAAVICVAVTVFFTCRGELKKMPAPLMRPKAPKNGKRVLLERITPIWSRFNFSQKVSARNIFRYKKRMFMTLLGIAGCTALTLTGFGLKDSISDIVNLQYSKVWHYNSVVAMDKSYSEEDFTAVESAVKANSADSILLKTMQKTYTAAGKSASYDANVVVPESLENLPEFLTLASRTTGEKYSLDSSGVIISEKLSSLLGLHTGDEITLSSGESSRFTATITAIVENYVSNFVYITPDLFTELTASEPDYSVVLVRYGGAVDENSISTDVLKCDNVLQFNSMDSSRGTFANMLNVMDLVVVVLIVSAGALAFVVLFNLTNINITERVREIATLKVLGFYDGEVSMYIFRENIILTLMGAVLGLGLGRILTAFVVKTAEIDMVMFGRHTDPLSFLWAFLITIAFSLIVSVIMHSHLKKIDMIESLKSVE